MKNGKNNNEPDFILNDGSLVEVKHRLQSTRDYRDALFQVIHQNMANPENGASHLFLVKPKISKGLIFFELNAIKKALKPDIAERLFVHVINTKADISTEFPLDEMSVEILSCLHDLQNENGRSSLKLPRPDLQSEVLRFFILTWLNGEGPVTKSHLSNMVGCSYRTVQNAVNDLGSAVQQLPDRRIYLNYFPEEAWTRFVANSEKSRNSLRFVDRSGQPRSVESLLRRFEKLALSEVAVGGVLGAKHHYPDLDMVGAPRIDLCMHAPEGIADLSFIDALDPALEESENDSESERVVVHFLRRTHSSFKEVDVGLQVADPVECLADLLEGKLMHQAKDFFGYIQKRGKEGGSNVGG